MAWRIKAVTEAGNAGVTVLAARLADARFPLQVTPQTILEKHRLPVRQTAAAMQAEAEGGSRQLMDSGGGGSGYIDGVAPFTHNGKYYPAETEAGVNEGHGKAFIRYVECA